MAILDLFPTPISISEVNLLPEELEKLMAIYDNQNFWSQNASGNFNSAETDIFRNVLGENSKFVETVQSEIDSFTSNVLGQEPTLAPTQSWLNFNPAGTKHNIHAHANSIVSGIFYIKTNDKTGNINFHKPENKSFLIENEIKTYNKYNFEYMFFTPIQGQLFLFPSYLLHSVGLNQSKITRISLSFNTFYNGDFGSVNNLARASFSVKEKKANAVLV